jgi:hypothetical protein
MASNPRSEQPQAFDDVMNLVEIRARVRDEDRFIAPAHRRRLNRRTYHLVTG